MEIINKFWFTQFGSKNPIGITVGKDSITGEIKTYIGQGFGSSESEDALYILDTGVKLLPAILKKILIVVESK